MSRDSRFVAIESLADARVDDYRDVRDADLRGGGRFVVEGRLNVRRLVEVSPYRVVSMLVTPTALEALGDCAKRVAEAPDGRVFVASQEVLNGVVGYNMHRGCLAVAERRAPWTLDALRDGVVVALDGLSDQENVGGVFRNAMAFGAAAVLLSPQCCDPLFRKALRVSMGGALRVPMVWADAWPDDLRSLAARGFEIVALHPAAGAEPIDTLSRASRPGAAARPTVLVAGAEGPGISPDVLAACDRRVRIPMASEVDSLNVATSVAIALHRLGSAE